MLYNDIIKDIFLGLLRRLPTDEDIKEFNNILKENGIKKVLETILNSNEFHNIFLQGKDPFGFNHPVDFIKKEYDVMIHVPKAGGTSLYHMMLKAFGEGYVSPLFIRLSSKPFSWYSKYRMIFGHFDYDEAKSLIVSKNLRFFSFLREPVNRLISWYYFFKSHDEEKVFQLDYVDIANSVDIKTFFTDTYIIDKVWLFNDMTRYIMGQSIWEEWKASYEKLKNQDIKSFLENEVRPIIKQRLKEYTFIGFQEDFERSSRLLFDILCKCFPGVMQENTSSKNQESFYFKKIQKEPIEESLLIQLNNITIFDKVLYDEAKTIYKDYTSKISTIDIPFLIDFKKGGNANKFIIKGFYETEDWGSWVSEESILAFNIKNIPKELNMRIRFNVFGHQQVKFYLNDFLFFVKTYEDEYVDMVFDISYLVKSQNTLKIKCPNAKSPKSLNISQDDRTIGIGLIDVEMF